jgi:hypothetical protein
MSKSYEAIAKGGGFEAEKAMRLWVLLERLYHQYVPARLSEVDITEVRVKKPKEPNGQVMVVVKARDEDTAYVAFHSADSGADALKGALERIQNKQLKWREDHYKGAAPGASE